MTTEISVIYGSEKVNIMSVAAARIITSIMVSLLLPSVHLIALIAYERYCFFVIPLRYTQTFTKYRFYTTVAIIYGIALCVGVGVDLIEPRIAVATSLSYQLQGMTGRISTIFYRVVYFTPSGAVSVLTLVRGGGGRGGGYGIFCLASSCLHKYYFVLS